MGVCPPGWELLPGTDCAQTRCNIKELQDGVKQACRLISLCFSHLECSVRPWHTVRALSVVMILTIITIPHKKQTRWEALDRSLMDRVQLDHWLSVRVTLPCTGLGSREKVMCMRSFWEARKRSRDQGLVLLSIFKKCISITSKNTQACRQGEHSEASQEQLPSVRQRAREGHSGASLNLSPW